MEGDPTTDVARRDAIVGVWKKGVAVSASGSRSSSAAVIPRTRCEARSCRSSTIPAAESSPRAGPGYLSGRLHAHWCRPFVVLRVPRHEEVRADAQRRSHLNGVLEVLQAERQRALKVGARPTRPDADDAQQIRLIAVSAVRRSRSRSTT